MAQVEFLANGGPIGSDGTAPYSLQWTDAAPGSYSLAARATDNAGDQTLSAPVSITVNAQPTVSITAPASGTVLQAPATIGLTATAADADGTLAKVEFFNEATLIGTATTAPYRFDWTNVPSGAYTLTAKATDDRGGNTMSSPVTVTVNAAPAVTLTAPATGARFIAPAAIQLVASVTDADGAIAKVEFYEAANLLATVPQPPYGFAWTHVALGAYTLFAKATDDLGAATLSAAVDITVAANTAPTVALTSPASNASYRAPATIALTATATDSDGAIAKVEFFQNQTLLATVTSAPYSFDWMNVGAGSYTLTAVATDDRGAVTASAPVTVNVASAQAAVYYIHPDHLNSPRAITDQSQKVVWQWNNDDPFGGNPPDEDPDGDGQRFEFNLRFPGQYFDKETNTHYNYFRTYDPSIGRYLESDPIGLRGGPNTYAYVFGYPLGNVDPFGLFACLYDPPNFDTANCVLISKSYTDRNLYQWRDTGSGVIQKVYLPKPQFGMGPPWLPPAPPQPPARPTVQVQGYWEIIWGYDERTLYRQNVLYVEEEWLCTGGLQCGPGDINKKRQITCFGDWTATSQKDRSHWIRSYYKPFN